MLNIGFSDAGVLDGTLDIPFGELTLANLGGLPALQGMSVRDFAALANRAIGGDATGYSLDDLNEICADLNASFVSGPVFFGPTDWAQSHLRGPA